MGIEFKLGDTVCVRKPAPFTARPGFCISYELDDFGSFIDAGGTFGDVTLSTQEMVDEFNARENGLAHRGPHS